MLLNADNTVYDPQSRIMLNLDGQSTEVLSLTRPKDQIIVRGRCDLNDFSGADGEFRPGNHDRRSDGRAAAVALDYE